MEAVTFGFFSETDVFSQHAFSCPALKLVFFPRILYTVPLSLHYALKTLKKTPKLTLGRTLANRGQRAKESNSILLSCGEEAASFHCNQRNRATGRPALKSDKMNGNHSKGHKNTNKK